MYRKDFVCFYTDPKYRVIKSCVCGTAYEIERVIKKLILSKKQGKQIFWKKVIA